MCALMSRTAIDRKLEETRDFGQRGADTRRGKEFYTETI